MLPTRNGARVCDDGSRLELAIFTSTLHEYAHDASVAVTMALHYFVFMPVSILIGSIVAWPAHSRRQSKMS